MKRRQFTALGGLALLAGCGRVARLNPFAWFGRGEPVGTAPALVVHEAEDPRVVVDQVVALHVDRTPGGAVVRATGLPSRQGWHSAGLVQVASGEPGVLLYQLRALSPVAPTPSSLPRSRELVVATYLSEQELAGIRQIQVSGSRNALVARR